MHRRWIGRWWMRSALIVVVCVMATTAVAQDNNDDALRSYYSGNGFLNRELYDLAAREYEAFLDAAPFHEKAVVARYGLAVSLVRLGRHADAVGHLEQLVGVNNFEYAAESLMMLGQSRLALGEYAKSANAFGTVLDRHSDSELADEAAALRSEAFYYNGDHALVDGPASILMDRFPDSPLRERTEFFRALAAMARAEFAPAADYFNAMLDRYPDGQYAGQATLLMGQCEHRADRLGNALSSYERVVERGNDTFVPDALYGMSIILHRDERFDDAEQALDRLLQSYPDNGNRANAQLLRGRVAFDQGEYANAMTFLEALSDGPMALRDDAAYWIGKCALREGRNGDAMQRLEDALQAYPDSALRAEMLYDIAVAAHREANYRKTSDALERFGREFPEHELAAAGMHLLASTMHQQERYDESTALCDQFSSTYVDHPMLSDVQFIAAENAYLQANYADADQRFQTYLTNHPNGERIIDAEFRRGMALYHLNDYARSRDVLKAVEAAARENDRYRLAIFTLGDM
ncbi:MAG: tetratricopeptide repeat protein, partial [Planctomycetota bacterium]